MCKIFFKKKDPKHKLNTSNTEEEGDNLRERKCKHLRWRRKKPHQTQQENVKHIKHIKHVRHIRTGQTHQTRQIQSVNYFEERSQTQRTHQIRGVKFFWRRKCQTQTQSTHQTQKRATLSQNEPLVLDSVLAVG